MSRQPVNETARRHVTQRLANAPPQAVAEALDRIESEDGYLPVWKTFVMGWDGTMFLERSSCGLLPDAWVWDVLSSEGQWLGSLTTPTSDFRILAGARDRIVALAADSLGVQRIEIHALEIGGPSTTGGGR